MALKILKKKFNEDKDLMRDRVLWEIRFDLKKRLEEETSKNQRLISEKFRIEELLWKSEQELNEFKK